MRGLRHRNPERGGSTISTLLTFVIIACVIFVVVKMAPPYMNNYQLQDSISQEARFAVVNHKGEDDVRADVMKKITELGVPATEKDIKVITTPISTTITIHYEVPVDLKFYQTTLQFDPTADGRVI